MTTTNHTSEMTPAELVKRIISGDTSAESSMVEKYQRGLMLMLSRKVGKIVAEDIAQETWRIVIEKVRQGALREPAALAGFIVQTGRNQLLMHFRRQKNHMEEFVEGTSMPANEDLSNAFDPECGLYNSQLTTLIKGLLKELKTPRDRVILTRYYVEEQDKEEICEALSISELHFNRVIFRAKKRFKSILDSTELAQDFYY